MPRFKTGDVKSGTVVTGPKNSEPNSEGTAPKKEDTGHESNHHDVRPGSEDRGPDSAG